MYNKAFLATILLVSFTCVLYAQEFTPPQGSDEEQYRTRTLDHVAKLEVVAKKEETATEAMAVVSVINRREIELFGAATLGEVLERVATTYLTGTLTFPDNQLSIRSDISSHFNSRVLILIDGRPTIGTNTSGIDSPILAAFPLNIIERIEISRGPNSIYHGSGAFSGVINIVTINPAEQIEAKIELGSSSRGGEYLSGAAGHSKLALAENAPRQDRISTIGAFTYQGNSSWDASLYSPSGKRVDYTNSTENIGAFLGTLYKGFSINTFIANTVTPTIQSGIFDWQENSQSSQMDLTRVFINVGYSRTFSNNWRSDYNVTYLNFTGQTNDLQFESSHELFGEATLHGNVISDLSFTLGTELRGISGEQPEIGYQKAFEDMNYRVYLNMSYDFTEYLNASTGFQFNGYGDDLFSNFTSRFGLRFYPIPNITMKYIYNEAYRNPSRFEYANPASQLDEHRVLPEFAKSTELQIMGEFSKTYFSLAYFKSSFYDRIIPVHADAYFKNDERQITTSGWEFETKLALYKNLYVTYSSSLNENRQSTENPKLFAIGATGTPTTFDKAGIAFFKPGKYSIGVYSNSYDQPQPLDLGNGTDKLNPMPNAFEWWSINAKVHLREWFQLKLYVSNLLDAEVRYPDFGLNSINSFIGRPGRTVYLGAEIRLWKRHGN